MLPVGSFIGDVTSGAGFMAAAIAVGGFLGQVPPALMRRDDPTVRALMVIGGLVGFAVAIGVIAGSALMR